MSILGDVTKIAPIGFSDLGGIADVQTKKVLSAIVDRLNVYEGTRGNPYDAKVSYRDLFDAGVVSVNINGEFKLNPNPPSGAIAPPTGDSSNDPDVTVVPGPVTDLTATGAVFTIHLQWNAVSNARFYEIWRSDSDDLGQAIKLGVSTFPLYADAVGANVTKYYWVRGVNEAGEGPFNATAGTQGQTSQAPNEVITLLAGAITETQLHTNLNSRINLIDASGTGLVDVTSGLQSSVNSLNTDVTNLEDSVIRTFVSTSAPSNPHTGDLWYNPSDNTRVKRWDGDSWEYVDDARIATALGDAATNATAISALDTRVDTAESNISANAAAITALSASTGAGLFDPAEDGLWEFENSADSWTDTNIDQTLNSYYITLNATASGPQFDSPTGTWDGGLYTQVIARIRRSAGTGWVGDVHYATSASGSNHSFSDSFRKNVAKPSGFDDSPFQWFVVAWDMEDLTAGGTDWVDNTITQIRLELGADGSDTIDVDWIAIARYSPPASSAALNSLEARVTTNESDISTNASDISALESTVNNGTTGVAANASAISSLNTRVTTAEGNITTNASDITALESTVNNASTGVVANANAISALDTRVTTAEGTITTHTSQISVLTSDLNDAESNISGNATAITALDTRVTSAEGNITSQASSITQLQSDVAGNTAAISTEATTRANSDGVLSAEYTVKLDVNGHVAGMGVAVSGGASGPISSDIIMLADKFSVALPNITFQINTAYTVGQYIKPTVATGFLYKVTVAGTTGGTEPTWPTTLGNTVGSGAVTFQCVAIEETVPFVVGTVNGNPTVAMSTAFIQDASITNAKIANIAADKITSGTISASIEMTAATVTGGLLRTSSGTGTRVEITNQGSFPFWFGTGAKDTANAIMYLDVSGNAVYKGDITGSDITGSTVTGGLVRTAVTGQRIELDGSTNEMYFYDSTETVQASIGINVSGSDLVVGIFGTLSSTMVGLLAQSDTKPALYGISNNDSGIVGIGLPGVTGRAGTVGGVGVYGESLSGTGIAVRGFGVYGGEFEWSNPNTGAFPGGQLRLVPKTSGTGWPTHFAEDGTFYYRFTGSDGPLFFRHNSKWWAISMLDSVGNPP